MRRLATMGCSNTRGGGRDALRNNGGCGLQLPDQCSPARVAGGTARWAGALEFDTCTSYLPRQSRGFRTKAAEQLQRWPDLNTAAARRWASSKPASASSKPLPAAAASEDLEDESNTEEAEAQQEERRARARRIKRLVGALGVCCRNLDIEQSHELLAELRQLVAMDAGGSAGTLPINAIRSVLYLHSELGDNEQVMLLLEEMKQRRARYDEPSSAIGIASLAKAGKPQAALQLMRDMVKSGTPARTRSYTPLIEQFALSGDLRMSAKLLDEAVRQSLEITPPVVSAVLQMDTKMGFPGNARAGKHLLKAFRLLEQDFPQDNGSDLLDWFENQAFLDPRSGEERSVWDVALSKATDAGHCTSCAAPLESIEISEDVREALCKEVRQNIVDGQSSTREMDNFERWLETKGKIDTVIDGLNMCYWRKARFDSADLAKVARHYQMQGSNFVIIIRLHTLKGEKQKQQLRPFLMQDNIFCTTNRAEDDLFFLYAALRSGNDVELVTNDCLRDYRYWLSQSGLGDAFAKWLRGHQVTMDFDYANGSCIPGTRRLYDSVVQNTKFSWHIPLADSDNWICALRANKLTG